MYGKRGYVGRKRWTKPSRLSIGVLEHNQRIEQLKTVDYRDNPAYIEVRNKHNLKMLIEDIRQGINDERK